MIEIKKIHSLICAVALTVSVLFATCVAKPAAETKPEIDDATIDNTIPANPNVEYLRAYATQMLSYMNRSVAPCDDFYEYACGNWKNVKQERQSQHKRSNLLDIVYTLADVAEELLLANTTLAEDLGYGAELRITQQFYNACLNAELYPLPAADPAYLALIKSVGGFPAVEGEAWLASNFSWFNMSSHLTNYGAQGLIYEKHLQQYPFMPYFKLPELGFDYIVHSDNIATNDTKGYKLNEKRMRGYLEAYGLPEEKIVEVIAGIFAFWREILKIADRFEEDSDKCDLLTDEFVTEPFPQWKQYYEISWNNLRFDPYPAERYCDFFYYELDKVCAKHKVAAANYMAMKLLYTMDAKLKAAKYQRDHCILTIQYSMPYLLDKLYFVVRITSTPLYPF